MRHFAFNLVVAFCLVALPAHATETNQAPDFHEVYKLLRSHLAGVTEEELNRAAVAGLLAKLPGKVALVEKEEQPASQTHTPLVSKSVVLESNLVYLRVGRVAEGLAKKIANTVHQLSESNRINGVALDLRFTSGSDYAAAAATADLFIADAKPLLDWGDGVVRSQKKFDIIHSPVAILVNRETSGAAEALAAVLRQAGAGLILGSATAGSAMISQEFTLKAGQRLRIGTSPVKLGDGSPLSPHGVKPDIEVAVSTEDERAYFDDAYALPGRTNLLVGIGTSATNRIEGTNRPARRLRPTEADLVRARRNGTNLDEDSVFVRDTEPEKPLIRDPALARAVDLLKGLAVVQRTQP